MPVSLKIVSFQGQASDNEEIIIDREGGSIGRLDSCNLVLPDKEKVISRHHAIISFEDGAFKLSDTSLAGTFIDDDPVPINNSSVILVDGMSLRIGEYQIQVNLLPENDEIDLASADIDFNAGPFIDAENSPFNEDNALLTPSENIDAVGLNISEVPIGIEEADSLLIDEQDDFVPAVETDEKFSSLHDSFVPPEPTGERHANDVMPDDFNFEELFNLDSNAAEDLPEIPVSEPVQAENVLLDGGSAKEVDEALSIPGELETSVPEKPIPVITEAVVEKPNSGEDANLYKAFLQGAEIQHAEIQSKQLEDRMRSIGSMFRQFVESTVAVLRSRAEFKSLFRVTVTTIKKADNNPLKFSVTTEEAMQHLLNDGKGGFKKSVDAIDEGFQDILNHQMAMQAGIQASLQEILRQFQPDKIEKQYEEGLILNKKAKCWERYSEIYTQLADTAIEDFYGDAFADAYEKQMKQIMSANHKKG